MEWLAYKNSNEAIQMFVAIIGTLFIALLIGMNVYYYIASKLHPTEDGQEIKDSKIPEEERLKMKAWQKPKKGDTMLCYFSDGEIVEIEVLWTDGVCRWSGKEIGGNRGWTNIPFYEGGNYNIFKVKQ